VVREYDSGTLAAAPATPHGGREDMISRDKLERAFRSLEGMAKDSPFWTDHDQEIIQHVRKYITEMFVALQSPQGDAPAEPREKGGG